MPMQTLVKTGKKSKKLDRYAGKWVAFLDGEIIAHNEALKDLMKEIDHRGLREKISVLLVPRKDEGHLIF